MTNDRDSIQARLLANIDDKYDKSEGGFFYDAEMPVAIILESAYTEIGNILDKRFADTATGRNLDRVVKDVGLSRKLTTQSTGIVTITGVAGSPITKGELVASDSVQFQFTETTAIPSSGSINVYVRCVKYGVIGNVPIGAIKYFPKTLQGLQTVTNATAFTNGYDEETDEELRERYYAKVQAPSIGGNDADYKNWALSITGVGGAKVIPTWNGGGTVKVIIINSNKQPADSELVSKVQGFIDPHINGDGAGIAPVGATCTVVSAIAKNTNTAVNITIDTSIFTSKEEAKTKIIESITNYLKSIAFKSSYVSYAKVGSLILSIDGIADYDSSSLLLNGSVANVNIAEEEIAILGGVTVG